MWQMLCRNYSRQKLYQCSLAVVSLALVLAECVELIAGQFQSQEWKISSVADGFSWLVKIPQVLYGELWLKYKSLYGN